MTSRGFRQTAKFLVEHARGLFRLWPEFQATKGSWRLLQGFGNARDKLAVVHWPVHDHNRVAGLIMGFQVTW